VTTTAKTKTKRMSSVERALVTRELGKAQAALWAAFKLAMRANELDLAKTLRDQHHAIGTKIVEINGGPVISARELIR
jgi:hypothetical protein